MGKLLELKRVNWQAIPKTKPEKNIAILHLWKMKLQSENYSIINLQNIPYFVKVIIKEQEKLLVWLRGQILWVANYQVNQPVNGEIIILTNSNWNYQRNSSIGIFSLVAISNIQEFESNFRAPYQIPSRLTRSSMGLFSNQIANC